MKFDSYQRFLKSDIYKECALLEIQGKPLPYSDDNQCDSEAGNSASTAGGAGSTGTGSSGSSSNGTKPGKKRKSIIPWPRFKASINAKAASLSSMPSTHKEMSFKRPMMMRKITNSITKIRSKSLDDHLTNHVKHHHETTHSGSVDKAVPNQKSLNLDDSRNSLVPNSSDSIDLSESNNVFSPSPDNKDCARLASLSNGSSESSVNAAATTTTSATTSGNTTTTTATATTSSNVISQSSFNHNCNRDNCHLLRVLFPDRSQTVVPSTPNETIDSLLRRLIEKRGLRYLAYDVFVTGCDKVSNTHWVGEDSYDVSFIATGFVAQHQHSRLY